MAESMKIARVALRILLALVTGGASFVIGLFVPLWTMMTIGKDPGEIAGGLLTMGVGIPLGIVCGIAVGFLAFSRTRPLSS